jgi:hypothetical protein
MLRKALAAGLLITLCLGFLAVGGNSQQVPPFTPPTADLPSIQRDKSPPVPSPYSVDQQTNPSFADLVTQLKNVRAQQEALKEQEKRLLEKLAQKVERQRHELQQQEQTLQQLRQPPTPTLPRLPPDKTKDERPPLEDKRP